MNAPRIRELAWDAWNLRHIGKHDVSAQQVEQVLHESPVFVAGYKDRLIAIGPDADGRILAVVVGPTPGHRGSWYVFSARPASRPERRYYADIKRDSEL